MRELKKLNDFTNENLTILKSFEMATIKDSKVADSCYTETAETDSDTGACDTRYFNYADTPNGIKLMSTYVN